MSTTIDRRRLTLTAMIFAVAMTFIDQTIVSVAAPQIQRDLGLSTSGLQWAVNSYLLAMAALFAFGGRLADTAGHRRMVTIGIGVFAAASALCGLTPTGSIAETWLIGFRALQGAGAALMYPAALAIVVNSSDVKGRGKALALFFGIAGGLTAVGPAAGGYLTAWTWRSIFWINIPVALIALVLIARARPRDERGPARLDVRGLVLVTAGAAACVFGLQQGAVWGWSDPRTVAAVTAGVVLLGAFALVELRSASPLLDLTVLSDRSFGTDTLVLFVATIVFVPVAYFASEYGQLALGESPSQASLLLLYFFAGFAGAAQFGGRMLDRIGARRPVVLGCVLAAIGLHEWAQHATTLAVGGQVAFIVMTGAGMGLMLGQANTDALNHVPGGAYGAATGLTQTVRNLGASLGLAGLGTLLVTQLQARVRSSLVGQGVPRAEAGPGAADIAQLHHSAHTAIPAFVRADFAGATSSVLTAMCWVMVAAAVVAYVGLPRSRRASRQNSLPSGSAMAVAEAS